MGSRQKTTSKVTCFVDANRPKVAGNDSRFSGPNRLSGPTKSCLAASRNNLVHWLGTGGLETKGRTGELSGANVNTGTTSFNQCS